MILNDPTCPISRGGVTYADLPGVRVWLLHERTPLTISLDRSTPPEPTEGVQREWQRRLSENPGLFNGPVMAVTMFDPLTGDIACRTDEYRRLLVQPVVDTGVVLLAISVVLTVIDAHGRRCVILGKRSPRTRIYGDFWELGPSGGVDLPAGNATRLGPRYLIEQCAHEMDSELNIPWSSPRLCAATYEHDARCLDLIVAADAQIPEGGLKPANWEYVEVRAVPMDELAGFDATYADRIIPPTRALFRFFGWVG